MESRLGGDRRAQSTDTQISQREADLERVAAPRVAGRLIIAPPCESEVEAVVGIGKAKPVPKHLIPVGLELRIFCRIGEVYDGRPEDGPVFGKGKPPGKPQFLAVSVGPFSIRIRVDNASAECGGQVTK